MHFVIDPLIEKEGLTLTEEWCYHYFSQTLCLFKKKKKKAQFVSFTCCIVAYGLLEGRKKFYVFHV